MQNTSVAIVHGYGHYNDTSDFQRRYVDAITAYLKKYSIQYLLCAGGFTNPKLVISEAGSLAQAIQGRGRTGDVVLEEDSMTTLQNVQYTALLLEAKKFTGDIHVLVSNIHIFKTMFFGLKYYVDYSDQAAYAAMMDYCKTVEKQTLKGTITIHRDNLHRYGIDLGRKIADVIRQIPSGIIETGGFIQHENLHNDFISYRKKKRGLT